MKYLLLNLAFLFMLSFTSAQELKDQFRLVQEKIVDESSGIYPYNFLGLDQQKRFVFHSSSSLIAVIGKGYLDVKEFLVHCDMSTGHCEKDKINWPEDLASLGGDYPESFNSKTIKFKDRFILLRSHINQDLKEVCLNAYSYNLSSNKLEVFKTIGKFSSDKYKFNKKYFDFSISPDSSKYIFFKEIESIEGGNAGYYYIETDAELNVLWQKEVILTTMANRSDMYNTIIDNGGTVHTLLQVHPDNGISVLDGGRRFDFGITSISNSGNTILKRQVEIEKGYFILTPRIGANNENKLLLTGLYGRHYALREGVFFEYFNDKTDIKVTHYHKFDPEFLTATLPEKKAEKLKKKILKDTRGTVVDNFFLLKDVISDLHGGFYITGEQRIVTKRSNGGSSIQFGDFMVIRLNEKSEVIWIKRLLKRKQDYLPDNRLIDYITFVRPDNIFCLYETGKGNIENRDDYKGYERTYWVAKFDVKTGNVERILLDNMVDGSYAPVPYSSFIWKNSLFIRSTRISKVRLIEINFKI